MLLSQNDVIVDGNNIRAIDGDRGLLNTFLFRISQYYLFDYLFIY